MRKISQAYEKIHKMENGFAQRSIEIEIDANSELIYNPLPVIPFKNSAFKNSLSVNLKDSSSKFILNEILTCGRVYSQGFVLEKMADLFLWIIPAILQIGRICQI